MRRALLIGIDNYPSSPLSGCVTDAKRLAELLARHHDGEPNYDCRVMVAPRDGETLGRAQVRQAIEQLFAHDANSAVLHFSGHGVVTAVGGALVTSDGQRYDEGIPMTQVLSLATRSPIPEITIFLDCCHAGALGVQGADTGGAVELREGIAVLAASGQSQVSVEREGGGLFTSLVCDALSGQAADLFGQVTVPRVYGHVDAQLGAWEQRPRFRANLANLSVLRRVAPSIDRRIVARLPVLFETEDAVVPLSPAHEPENEPRDPAAEALFAALQALRARGLVEPVDHEHMYHAAIHGGGCRLTVFGRRFWHLAKAGRL